MNKQNSGNLPTEPPAIGGWFWNEKTQQKNFQMPPFPGVDDCVRLPNGDYAYRSFYERDRRAEARQVAPLRFKESDYTLNMLRQLINAECMADWRNGRFGWGKELMRPEHVALRDKLRRLYSPQTKTR